MKKLLEWLLSFFKHKSEEQDRIENKIEQKEDDLRRIENEENSDDDLDNYLND